MIQKIIKVGTSAAIVIPKKALKELGFKIGESVSVNVYPDKRRVEIKPEIIEFTTRFIKKYNKALKSLSDK